MEACSCSASTRPPPHPSAQPCRSAQPPSSNPTSSSRVLRPVQQHQRRRAGARVAAPAAAPGGGALVAAGPPTPPPDYAAIDAQPLNRLVYTLFRRRMVQAIGADSPLEG